MGNCEARPRPPRRFGCGSERACVARKANTYQEVQLAVTELFCILGVPAFHSSVILDGHEYYFDADGITTAPPFWSHGGPRHLEDAADDIGASRSSSSSRRNLNDKSSKCMTAPTNLRTKVVVIGKTEETGGTLVQALAPFFEAGSYDVLHKNCNAFADVALSFLTHRRLDAQYTRMERMLLAAEPLSTGLLNQLFRAVKDGAVKGQTEGGGTASRRGGDEDLTEYLGNPAAQGFSAESVIALLVNGEVLTEDSYPDDGICPCCSVQSAWACGPQACSSACDLPVRIGVACCEGLGAAESPAGAWTPVPQG